MPRVLRGVSWTRSQTPAFLFCCLLIAFFGGGFLGAQGRSRFRLAEVRGQILPAKGEFQLPKNIRVSLIQRELGLNYYQDVRSGMYSFQDLGDGYYQLEVSSSGYESVTESVHVEGSLRGQVLIHNVHLGNPLGEGPFRVTREAGQTIQAEQLQLPKQVREHLDKATEAAAGGLAKEAVRHYEKALKKDPDLPRVWNNLAVQYLKLGEMGSAQKALKRALELDPDDLSANQNLALLLIAQRRFEDALTYLQRLYQWLPQDMRIRAWLAESYFQTHHYRLALFNYQTVAAREPDNIEWLLKLGDCYTRLGKIEEAIESLEKFLDQSKPGVRSQNVRNQINRLRGLLPGSR